MSHAITQEQKQLLQQFTCERLTARRVNKFDIKNFLSVQGKGLENTLKTGAWEADLEGSIAYYLVRNPAGEIVLYFSLKCGMLFDPNFVELYLESYKDELRRGDAFNRWTRLMDGDERQLRYFQRQRTRMGAQRYSGFIKTMKIKTDKKYEPNQKIIRTKTSQPAIELVEFCANDLTKDCWASYGFPSHRRLGETLFWWFVFPKMMEINALIGCKYVYLFAADEAVSGKLSNYYRERLHFENLTDLGTVKPAYDLNCFFMGRQLRDCADPAYAAWMDYDDEMWGLEHYQKQFFEEFNLEG